MVDSLSVAWPLRDFWKAFVASTLDEEADHNRQTWDDEDEEDDDLEAARKRPRNTGPRPGGSNAKERGRSDYWKSPMGVMLVLVDHYTWFRKENPQRVWLRS